MPARTVPARTVPARTRAGQDGAGQDEEPARAPPRRPRPTPSRRAPGRKAATAREARVAQVSRLGEWSEVRQAGGPRSRSATGSQRPRPARPRVGLIVSDIEAAHDGLVGLGIDVSDVWHGPPFPVEARQRGPDPERRSRHLVAIQATRLPDVLCYNTFDNQVAEMSPDQAKKARRRPRRQKR